MKCSVQYERRVGMIVFLKSGRWTTLDELAKIFGVCKRTAQRDIDAIALSYNIQSPRGNGGGIHMIPDKKPVDFPTFDHYLALKCAADCATDEDRAKIEEMIEFHWDVELFVERG